jgi:KaiC
VSPSATTSIRSGIGPLDERIGGLERGGTYLVVGAPGPAKMVAALHFVSEGVSQGERCLLVTNADVDGVLGVANAWGFDMWEAWESGTLQLVGFRDDFELRAIRSIEPEEVLEELDAIVSPDVSRIAVDPGVMFLTGGAKTLLGSAFLHWARRQEATTLATFSVDGGAASLPSSADWLVHATTGRLLLERRSEGLYQIRLAKGIPDPDEREQTISLELKPGTGLVLPESYPARRGVDRGGIDENRLLLVSLGASHASDLEAWATRVFEADVVSEPFEAVAKVQAGTKYGGVLIHAPRKQVREAVQACRALRPLTRAAMVFASDDAIRSTDRIHILEAGADDCLSGGLDFRELRLRIRQSIATGAKPVLADGEGVDGTAAGASLIPEESDGGRVPRGVFLREIERRAADPDLAFFCVLDVTSAVLAPADLESVLAEQVRADEGDIVSGDPERCAVLLQGAREGQLGPFLDRLRSRLEERAGQDGDPGLDIGVLSHPAESDRILALLGTSRGEES